MLLLIRWIKSNVGAVVWMSDSIQIGIFLNISKDHMAHFNSWSLRISWFHMQFKRNHVLLWKGVSRDRIELNNIYRFWDNVYALSSWALFFLAEISCPVRHWPNVWVYDYIHMKVWGSHPCPNFNSALKEQNSVVDNIQGLRLITYNTW